jgi:hypothetical protein
MFMSPEITRSRLWWPPNERIRRPYSAVPFIRSHSRLTTKSLLKEVGS